MLTLPNPQVVVLGSRAVAVEASIFSAVRCTTSTFKGTLSIFGLLYAILVMCSAYEGK